MNYIQVLVDLFLHLDKNLGAVISSYGLWTYLILFALVFCETGLVVTPFLPGDSLLFVAGAFAASGSFNLFLLFSILGAAAILGDTVNYQIGHWVGPKAFSQSNTRLFKKEHLERTQLFYEKHGGKTIIIARFVPVIRTFAPFVAGIGKMNYFRFLSYNLIGGLGWVIIVLLSGYLFGNLPVVRNNFSLVVLAIIFISILPAIITYFKEKRTLPLKQ
ncbi:MAG: DedA family protein [Bacillota bacterium]|nr:DedA family protein [Bacillota bacterium]